MNIKRSVTLLLVGLLAISSVAGPAAAQQVAQTNQINPEASAAQNPYIAVDTTISTFDRSTMQPGEVEDNSGDIVELNATIDSSDDVDDLGDGTVNQYHFIASDIQFADSDAFPHAESNVSAVNNESKWTTDESSTAGSMTVADSSTASGVEALEVSTSGQSSSDVAVASFSDVSITSDAEKRYLQSILDVNSRDSETTVEIRAVDADDDYVGLNVTNSGEGIVTQEQIGELSVSGSGDGTMSEIQRIEIVISDGNADLDISALNADKSSPWTLGDERVENTDGDGLETETITSHGGGEIMIHDLGTMGVEFEDATINDLTAPMNFRSSDLGSDRTNVTFSESPNYPSFEQKQTARYRLLLPDYYDISYSNAELRQESNIPESR